MTLAKDHAPKIVLLVIHMTNLCQFQYAWQHRFTFCRSREAICNRLRPLELAITIGSAVTMNSTVFRNAMSCQSECQPTLVNSHILPNSATRSSWQRWRHPFFIAMVTLLLFIALANPKTAYARRAPTSHDRRPDRETRIPYPRTQPQSATPSNRGQPLFSGPPTQPSSSTSEPIAPDSAPNTIDQDESD